MKVVLDTMMWVSYSTHADGRRAAAIDRAFDLQVRFFVSNYILDELEKVLSDVFLLPTRVVKRSRRRIERLAELTVLPTVIPEFVTQDPNDNPVIQSAISSKSDYVVTADKALLALKQVQDVRIIGLEDFAVLLPSDF